MSFNRSDQHCYLKENSWAQNTYHCGQSLVNFICEAKSVSKLFQVQGSVMIQKYAFQFGFYFICRVHIQSVTRLNQAVRQTTQVVLRSQKLHVH